MIALSLPHDTISNRRATQRARRPLVMRTSEEVSVTVAAEPDVGELMRRIAQDADRAAFQALFLQLAPRVKTYLIRHGAPPGLAEDLAQETLLTVWRKAAYFDPAKASVAAWVFTIARNLRIDTIRRERSAMAYALAAPEPQAAPETPEDDSQTAEREVLVNEAIKSLPREQLEVVRLSFFFDKPHAEIANELSLPLGTVKSRLRLALAKLRGVVGDLA
jgi:RNA polymerase sigma-70 factor, ECF subfamily